MDCSVFVHFHVFCGCGDGGRQVAYRAVAGGRLPPLRGVVQSDAAVAGGRLPPLRCVVWSKMFTPDMKRDEESVFINFQSEFVRKRTRLNYDKTCSAHV